MGSAGTTCEVAGMNPAAVAYTARWVWCGPGDLRENAWVLMAGGWVRGVQERPPAGAERVELGQGLLLPGLVNAHTHLELSGLTSLAPPAGDFVAWLEQLVALRPDTLRVNGAAATRAAAAALAADGTALVGDITNTGQARAALAQAGVSAVSFFEALGPSKAPPPPPGYEWQGPLLSGAAVAAHAPYSVPAGRLQALKRQAGDLPFCLHLAESRAEMEFMAGAGEQGRRLEAFLAARGLQRSQLDLRAATPLGQVQSLGLLDQHTLAVHGVQLRPEDARTLAAAGTSLCLCPRSNLGLTGNLAPVEAMLAAGVNLALGTDSLASAPDLSLWREMAALAAARPGLDPETILAMATAGGARALGLAGRFGAIRSGAAGPLAFAPLAPLPPEQMLAAAVQGRHAGPPRSLGRG
ncbi:MAG: amidohydrolase [Desulfarculus sp.]|nr:MAG: amidohydrolase [Desulfarculus sp.]